VIYLDSSSLVKLIREEPESNALKRFLESSEFFSCELALTELGRSAVRHAAENKHADARRLLAQVSEICDAIALVPLDRALLAAAGMLGPFSLRSLDAIHVAAALEGDSDEFVTYDRRQADAARSAGLKVTSPGS
jgi:predicted nucleic acid-binding protein